MDFEESNQFIFRHEFICTTLVSGDVMWWTFSMPLTRLGVELDTQGLRKTKTALKNSSGCRDIYQDRGGGNLVEIIIMAPWCYNNRTTQPVFFQHSVINTQNTGWKFNVCSVSCCLCVDSCDWSPINNAAVHHHCHCRVETSVNWGHWLLCLRLFNGLTNSL